MPGTLSRLKPVEVRRDRLRMARVSRPARVVLVGDNVQDVEWPGVCAASPEIVYGCQNAISD
jgi:hypothetical protein